MTNVDEIHFLINLENRKTFRLVVDEQVKYANLTSSGECMTTFVSGVQNSIFPEAGI